MPYDDEEYEEQLELTYLTSSIMDNDSGAHQKRWENLWNNPEVLVAMLDKYAGSSEPLEDIVEDELNTIANEEDKVDETLLLENNETLTEKETSKEPLGNTETEEPINQTEQDDKGQTPDGKDTLESPLKSSKQKTPQKTTGAATKKGAAPTRTPRKGAAEGFGASDRAIGFSELPATEMTRQHAAIGGQLKEAANKDVQYTQGKLKPLDAQLSGAPEQGKDKFELKGKGADNAPEKINGDEPPVQDTPTHTHHTNEPPKAEAPEKEDEGFFSQIFDAIEGLLDSLREMLHNVPVQDPGISTATGEAPEVRLQGKADPKRSVDQMGQRQEEMQKEKKRADEALAAHPGPGNIKPIELKESFEVPVLEAKVPDLATVENEHMARYREVNMPTEVRQLGDAQMAEILQPHLDAPRKTLATQMDAQEKERTQTLLNNDKDLKALNKGAQDAQDGEVKITRKSMQDEMKKGQEETQKMVTDFEANSSQEQTKLQGSLDTRVQADNVAAREELRKGADEASRLQVDAEKRAQEERNKAEKEDRDRSILDHAGDFLGDVWEGLTSVINDIFEEVRGLISAAIEAAQQLAIDLIEAGRQWVVEQIDSFRDWLKDKVNEFLSEHFPALAKAINQVIDDLANTAIERVNKFADDLKEGVKALAEKLAKTIDNILSAIQEGINTYLDFMGAVLSGDFAKAMEIMFLALCKVAGVDPKEVMELINNVGDLIGTIYDDPMKFLNNVLKTADMGLGKFLSNIMTHLGKGLMTWLMGPLGKLNIKLPEKFDMMGIASLSLQVLGLTYENIRERSVARLEENYPGKGEQIVGTLETSAGIVMDVYQNGVGALWTHLEQFVGNIQETVMGGIKSFVSEKIVSSGIQFIMSMVTPAGAVIKALTTVYDFVMFIRENWERIMTFAQTVYKTVADIAAGNVEGAAGMLENALAQTIPMVLDFLARLLNVDGITEKIQDVLEKLRAPINKGIDYVLNLIIKAAQGVIKGGKGDDNELSDNKNKKHKDISENVKRELKDKKGTEGKNFDEFYKAKTEKAEELENQYQPRLEKGIKIKISYDKLEEEKKDNDIDFKIRIAPNDLNDKVTAEPEEPTAKEAHDAVMAKMDASKKPFLEGHGSYTVGHAGRKFSTETKDAVDEIGYSTGCHSTGDDTPGTKTIDKKTKHGKLGEPNWIPDHQPADTLLSGGATGLTFRFYPHSHKAARKQGGIIRVYKMWMKKERNRGNSNWAEGVESDWFW